MYKEENHKGSKVYFTDKNIFDNSYYLVKHFPDFLLWEYRIASLNAELFIKGSNSVLPKREIR